MKERWRNVNKRSCADGGFVPLRTTGTSDNFDVPRLCLREDVDYQNALHELFVICWNLEDKDSMYVEIVKLYEPYGKNWRLSLRTNVFRRYRHGTSYAAASLSSSRRFCELGTGEILFHRAR